MRAITLAPPITLPDPVTLPQPGSPAGLTVSSLCLGTSLFGSQVPEADAFALLDAYADAGGTFLDTARVYADWLPDGHGASERTVGRWLKQRQARGRTVLATKGAHPSVTAMHVPRMSAAAIAADLHASLKLLGVDHVDLYWLHRDDPARPVGEALEALETHRRAGSITWYGCSNWQAARIAAAQEYAAAHGLRGFIANQPLWSLAAVTPGSLGDPTLAVMDAAMLALHRRSELAAIPYSSQGNGFFQRLAAGTLGAMSEAQRKQYAGPENDGRLARIRHVAAEQGLSISQVVLGYLLAQPFPVVPIIGCRTLAQLHDTLTAADVRLDAATAGYLVGTN